MRVDTAGRIFVATRCGDKVFKRKVKAKGVEGMNAPVKPEKPRW